MAASQRLLANSTMPSPSYTRCANSFCARTKRGEDGGTPRVLNWRISTVLYALACVLLATWTAYCLWEVSSADALPHGAELTDVDVTPGDGTLDQWLEQHVMSLGTEDTNTGEYSETNTPHATREVFRPKQRGTPRLQALTRNNLRSLPQYAYRSALADRTSSNIRDVARLAAEDRRDSERNGARHVKQMTAYDAEKRKSPALKRIISTHHKTGTALMHDIFSTIIGDAKGEGYHTRRDTYGAFVDMREMEDHPERFAELDFQNARFCGVVLDYHLGKALPQFMAPSGSGDLEQIGLPQLLTGSSEGSSDSSSNSSDDSSSDSSDKSKSATQKYLMVHVVRDPVEVLVSGYLYHRRLPPDEGWLHQPAPGNSDGKSYGQVIENTEKTTPLAGIEAEIAMADDELRTLVLAFRDCDRDLNCLNVKLEDFHGDKFDVTLENVLRHLQFRDSDIPSMVKLAEEFDTSRWSVEEKSKNEHFTKNENRIPFVDAIKNDKFLNATTTYIRYALGYTQVFPEFQ